MNTAIELQSLSKVYYNKDKTATINAVDNINLKINKGEIFGFLGPNGAGKTTTIKMICNLITPSAGTIKLNGYDVSKNKNLAMQSIGAVLEGSRNTHWQLSIKQNLSYFGQLKGAWGKKLDHKIEEILTDLDLCNKQNLIVNNLSRGTQQKVAIGCALIADPEILLLDEPTLGLDFYGAKNIESWLSQLAKKKNKTIVITTHQLDLAERLCSRIGIIFKGKILENKKTDDFLKIFENGDYKITVAGTVTQNQNPLGQMKIIHTDGVTIFSGKINSPEELYRKIDILKNLGFNLVSISPVEHNLEDVFVKLIDVYGNPVNNSQIKKS